MLVVIAGMIGAGKSTIAREMAVRLSIPFFSIDEVKIRVGQTYPGYRSYLENSIPFPDEMRQQVYAQTLEGLQALAQTHRHAIVEETFHKKHLREPFFAAADIFNGILLTQVVHNDDLTKIRLDKICPNICDCSDPNG